jgi:chromosome segregation ATPase
MAKKKKVESTLKNLSFESAYEVDSSFDNIRFIRLKCRIMHSGVNPNFSHFSLDAIEKARPTLSNIPILANVVIDENNNADFGAHDLDIEEGKDGEMRLTYKELPVGLIPETNDYAIEEHDGRQYVTCTGYIWRGYSNLAEEIIENKGQTKLSMEIMVDEVSELEDDEDYFDIKDYKYTGITLLGDKYGTGMLDAKAEKVEFNIDDNKEAFVKMAQELKFALEQSEKEECAPEHTLEDSKEGNEVQDTVENDNVLEDTLEDNKEDNLTDNIVEEDIVEEDIVENDVVEESTVDYELEITNLQKDIHTFLKDVESFKSEIETLKSELSSKDKLINELQEYKNKIELEIKKSAVDELIEDFTDVLKDSEEFVELKKTAMEMEISDLEKELYALEGKLRHDKRNKKDKKFNFSKVVPNDGVKKDKVEEYYGTASKYFKK